MEQLSLLSDVVPTPGAEEYLLDASRYDAERKNCKMPDKHPASAYRYGCRCIGCYKFHSAEAHHRSRNGGVVTQVCKAPGCTNPRRQVQAARYCEDHAVSKRYELTGVSHRARSELKACTACGKTSMISSTNRWGLCHLCRERNAGLLQSAHQHRASFDQVLHWIIDRRCHLCRHDLYLGKGKRGASGYCIDHDHTCCDGSHSCGACIRGMLCNACNVGLGCIERLLRDVDIDQAMKYINSRRQRPHSFGPAAT